MLAFTGVLAILTTLVFGLLPAFRATRLDVTTFLKDGDSASGSLRGRRARSALVLVQVALSVVVLVAAGLFLHSLRKASSIDLGFRPENVLVLRVDPSLQGYSDERSIVFLRQLQERISALPGVRAASFVAPLPLSLVGSGRDFTVPGTTKTVNAEAHLVGAGYFKTMGIPLLRGHDFSPDMGPSPLVAVISQAAAKQLFGAEDPIGQNIQNQGFGTKGPELKTYKVAGVVGDAKSKTVGEALRPCVYLFLEQNAQELGAWSLFGGLSIVVKTAGNPQRMITPVVRQVERLDPDLPVYGVATMQEQVDKALFLPRVAALLLTVFGILALTLAGVGLYGVMSYAVACRTREIGIRMALGATAMGTIRMLAREGLAVVGIGLVVGFGIAAVVSRFATSFLYGVSSADPATFTVVPLVLLLVGCLAIIVPARRATKVDPVVALRYE